MRRLLQKPSYKISIQEDRISSLSPVDLTVSTWEKDSHGLFDYQSNKLTTRKFKINGPCKLFRNWTKAETELVSNEDAKKGKIPNYSYNFLASVGTKQNGHQETFCLYVPEKPNYSIFREGQALNGSEPDVGESGPLNTSSYLVVKGLKSKDGKTKGYALSPGDVIKLGRMQYLVIECQNNRERTAIQGSVYLSQNSKHTVVQDYFGTCKVCLEQDATHQNFLLSPCMCKGSCQVIHLDCLKTWINNKVKKQSSGLAMTYNFVKFECELCKQAFPKLIQKGDQVIQMLEVQRPNKPYIMFQSMSEEKNLYVITADQQVVIQLGRGHQCEIRMVDISVSRLHSEIKLIDDQFYISDNNSKFGTLIRINKDMEIEDGMQIQCGRSLYTFQRQAAGSKSSAYL